jgi:predicted MFS family arabinose efflux permease
MLIGANQQGTRRAMAVTAIESAAAARAGRAQMLSILIGASVMLSLTMGMRQSLGLFMGPITRDLGITAADFTFAIAIQNITWGLTQPFFGAAADRWGHRPIMLLGAIVYAAGLYLTMIATGAMALTIGSGLLIGVALSCGGASLAMSASARAVPERARSLVLGIVSAAGSLGTVLAAPMAQSLIVAYGWHFALVGFLGLAAAMLPACFLAGGVDRIPSAPARRGEATLGGVLREAARHRGFLVMTAAYFVCGLQLVFLTTHLPTYLAICGMDPMLSAEALSVIGFFNVLGSWLFGWLGGRYPKHVLLGLIYIVRSAALAIYFALPATPATTLLFAATMGTLWLGVVPLVSGLVAHMFGVRFMATLTGVAFLSHQIGSFLGAWGGGLIFDALGSYDRAWQIGVAIGLLAGAAQILLHESPRAGTARPVPAAA